MREIKNQHNRNIKTDSGTTKEIIVYSILSSKMYTSLFTFWCLTLLDVITPMKELVGRDISLFPNLKIVFRCVNFDIIL
jgi:hypothetical protein